jgi:PAS domain S-box-containing protein
LRAHLAHIVGWLTCLVMLGTVRVVAAEPPLIKRVLVLHQELASRPFRARFNAAFVEAMRTGDSAPIDIYEEGIEPERFQSADQMRLATDYLRNKYAGRKIDVIVVVGVKALAFARENRRMFGDSAIVAAVSQAGHIAGRDEDVTGLQDGFWIGGTLDLALALRPDTRYVFVVDGTHDNEGDVQTEIERELARHLDPLSLVYLRNLPVDDLVKRIAAVPDRSIVLFVRQTLRNRSQDLDPFEGLSQVVSASPVPVFSQVEEFMGHGVMGGHMWRFEEDARRMAVMARMIVKGARARDIPAGQPTYATLLDWRQMQRWQIPEAHAPAGALILFRPESFLEQYRRYVVGGLLVFALQLALTVGLLVHRLRRRRAEGALRNSEERYRSVVDTQSELICRFLQDTTLTFVNDAYCRFWNKTRDDLLGRKFIDLIPASSRHAVLDHIARIRTGTYAHEHPVTLADGTIGWHHWINQAIVDERGDLLELQGVGRDITDRKRAEAAVGQLEARNSAILRAIPDLMFVLLRDGTYVDYHARDPRLLAVPPDQLIGRTIREIMPPALADTLMDAVERACLSEEPVVVEYELPMDEPRQFEARLVYAEHDCVLSIVRDVTESKRALALNHDLAGRLIASQEVERSRIARDLHDGVCQDVAAVSVDLSHLRQSGGDIRSDVVQEVLLSVERRTATVAENLRLLSHGLHPSVLQHIGLVAALQAHCAEVERQQQLRVTFFAEGDVEPASRLVSLSVFRIAQEALRNAARHGHARNATVSLLRRNRGLTLAVADDGQGFDVAAVRQKDGLGLVSIVERARLVRGHVDIRSEPGGGTTINVSVPIDATDHHNRRSSNAGKSAHRRPPPP